MENKHIQQSLNHVFNLLKYTFVAVPIITGLDKFTNLLTNWELYLNPFIVDIIPFSATTFMMIVGVIEIIAGLILLVKSEIGGYIVSAWLVSIAITLLASGNYIDVAVRDLVMAISVFSMARISRILTFFKD